LSAEPDTGRGGLGGGDKKKGEMKAELHIKFSLIIFVQKLEKKY
jgi:hypothetical protein